VIVPFSKISEFIIFYTTSIDYVSILQKKPSLVKQIMNLQSFGANCSFKIGSCESCFSVIIELQLTSQTQIQPLWCPEASMSLSPVLQVKVRQQNLLLYSMVFYSRESAASISMDPSPQAHAKASSLAYISLTLLGELAELVPLFKEESQ